jgi:hypothetical protein
MFDWYYYFREMDIFFKIETFHISYEYTGTKFKADWGGGGGGGGGGGAAASVVSYVKSSCKESVIQLPQNTKQFF